MVADNQDKARSPAANARAASMTPQPAPEATAPGSAAEHAPEHAPEHANGAAPPDAKAPAPEMPSAEARTTVPGDKAAIPAAVPPVDALTETLPQELTDGLQVEVRFQLGELILPLKALANLQPEQVLTPLNGFEFPKVKAMSAGRCFAEGELVRVGDRIGFRVTKICA